MKSKAVAIVTAACILCVAIHGMIWLYLNALAYNNRAQAGDSTD